MASKHRSTLEAIRADPVRANIPWRDVESLLRHLGATVAEGAGSRVHFVLNGVARAFHRPHPRKETKKYVVKLLRDFLAEAGIDPEAEP